MRSVPENLSRHPDEQKFTTALKIDQLFTVTMADRPNKKKLIYDGQCWQKIPESVIPSLLPYQQGKKVLKDPANLQNLSAFCHRNEENS